MSISTIHHRACNLCEAICGLEITVENGQITSIVGDKSDPLSKGHICPKAFALKDIYEDPNRLREPIRRKPDGSWEKIDWSEALDYVADKLHHIKTQYGADAIGFYSGNPSVHNWGTILNIPALVKTIRSKNFYSATSLDQLPHHVAAWSMFGHPLLIPIPDISRTDYMLIMGGNPMASNGSLMTAPNMGELLKGIKQRGGKTILLDPRRTETADRVSEHHFIRPASDVFFLLALLNVLFSEKKIELPFDTVHGTPFSGEGVENLEKAVAEFTPEAVSAITGLDAATIRRLAHEFAAAKSAVAYGRMGLSVQKFGGLCQWLINCLNIVTGNFDRVGGAMFPLPALDVLATAKHRPQMGRWRSRVRQLPEFMGELPSATLADEILTEGEGQIRAMITNAGNPVLSSPNGQKLDTAFGQLDFMVSFDIYLNETTRHAHIILPPATGLETSHYDVTFHLFAIRNTAKYSPPLFAKAASAKYDWEILQELTYRLAQKAGNTAHGTPSVGEGGFSPQAPEQQLDFGLRYGPYQLSLQQLLENPSGVDLGELKPVMPERLAFEDKKIRLAPDMYLADLKRAAEVLKKTPSAPTEGVRRTVFSNFEDKKTLQNIDFQLIGRRHQRDCNSWLHNSAKLMKGKNRCTLLIHPDDAAALRIAEKQMVHVRSRVGTVALSAELSPNMMRGVVSIPHGYGHNRQGIQLRVAEQYAGVSINDLTDEQDIDELTGNAVLNGVPVRLEPIE
jgi:anaerobic selenocysteine-containing dehydrogenase